MSKFFKKIASLTLATSLVAALASCSTPSVSPDQLSNDQATASATKAGKKWTMFVHLAADNNLYPFGLKDMAEMAYGFNSTDTNIVVLFDGEKKGDSAIYEITHSDKKPATGSPITSKKLTTPVFSGNEVDSGDPALMAKFLDWGTKAYPAEHTAVVVWNHGNGIFRNGQLLKPKKSPKGRPDFTSQGFAWDDNGGNMDMKDLGPIFQKAVANLGKKVDVLDFDACLMAHVEAAYQIQKDVNFLVASEKTEAGDGNDYIGIAQAMSKNPNMSGSDFAKMMVDAWAKSYSPGGNQYSGPEEYTLSAADTTAVVNGLTPAIMDLATDMAKNPALAKKARAATTSYDGDDEARDLGHFLNLLSKDPGAASLKAKADKVNEELKKAVIREAHNATRGVGDSTGLVIYFPAAGDSFRSKYNPTEIKFAENAPWVDFLKKFIATK